MFARTIGAASAILLALMQANQKSGGAARRLKMKIKNATGARREKRMTGRRHKGEFSQQRLLQFHQLKSGARAVAQIFHRGALLCRVDLANTCGKGERT